MNPNSNPLCADNLEETLFQIKASVSFLMVADEDIGSFGSEAVFGHNLVLQAVHDALLHAETQLCKTSGGERVIV